MLLDFAAAFEGAGHGDLVGVLDVGAGGDAGGDAGDAQRGVQAVDLVGEVAGGGFAFDGGAGGEDQFFGFGESWPEVGEAKLLRADAVDG